MRIILLQDVAHVGKKNEIKEVSDGFARNFLIPRRMASLATVRVLQELSAMKTQDAKKQTAERERSVNVAEKLKTVEVLVKIKVGGKGKAFGSVNAAKIVEQLKSQHHIELEKAWVRLDGPLKSTGKKEIPVRLPQGVEGTVRVDIQSEE